MAAAATTDANAATPEPKTALIIGSTGAVGSPLLSALLSRSSFTHIHSFVRSSSTPTSVPTIAPTKSFSQHTIDYDRLLAGDETETAKLRDVSADVVFITLGTTRADAASAQQFEKVDRDYVLAAAKAACGSDVAAADNKRIVYCSSQAANLDSPFLYLKSKGLTEQGLAKLGGDVVIFRPAFLAQAQRKRTRIAESLYGRLTGLLSKFSSSVEIPVTTLALAMVQAGHLGSAGLASHGIGSAPDKDYGQAGSVTIVSNAEALKLGKE
ncbi:hypothetical protein ACQY0O_006380 [Thecaphora frezii]